MINKFDLNNISRKLSTTGNKVYISRSHASHPDQSHVVWQCTLMYSQSYGFSRSHVQMWKLDHKEGWVLKNWCFQIVVLEKTLASPLDSKEIQSVHAKGNQSWIFMGRTNAETAILWPPDAKNVLIWKTLMLGKIEGRRRKGRQRMRWLDGIANSMDMSLSITRSWWWTGKPGVLQFMGSQRIRHDWVTELNWTELNWTDEPVAIYFIVLGSSLYTLSVFPV